MQTHSTPAIAQLDRAVLASPKNAKAIAHRGEAYRLQEEYDRALEDFDRAISLQPDYAWAIAHRGAIFATLKRYENALHNFNKALDLQPDYIWAIAHRGETLRYLGDFWGKDYYWQAIADFDRAIALKSDYAWAIFLRCRTYELLRHYKTALIDFDRALSIDPNILPSHKNWRYERGLILCYDNQYAAAIAECEERIKEEPRDYTAWYCLTVSKAKLQGLETVRKEIETTREILNSEWERGDRAASPEENRGDILYRLSGLAALEGNIEKAWTLFEPSIPLNIEAIELLVHDPAWYDWLNEPKMLHFMSNWPCPPNSINY